MDDERGRGQDDRIVSMKKNGRKAGDRRHSRKKEDLEIREKIGNVRIQKKRSVGRQGEGGYETKGNVESQEGWQTMDVLWLGGCWGE